MKKLLLYSLFVTSTLFSNAQTFNAGTLFSGYVNYNPDSLLWYTIGPPSHNTIFLDLFGDSNNDIELRADAASSPGGTAAAINIISHNPDVYIRYGRLDSVYIPQYSLWDITKIAKPLNSGEPIDPPGAVWNDTMLYLTDHSSYGGGAKNVNDWIGGDKYIGLKYVNGSAVNYGWIKVNFQAKDSAHIMEYSFMEGYVGIKENTLSDNICLYPNPTSGTFIINAGSIQNFDQSYLKITDVLGQEINFETSAANGSIRITLQSSAAEGTYFLIYKDERSSFTERFIKL